MPVGTCRHCKEPKTWLAARDLCTACYGNLDIRNRYPLLSGTMPEAVSEPLDDGDPTEEELERTIREQRKNLPAWWREEESRKHSGNDR